MNSHTCHYVTCNSGSKGKLGVRTAFIFVLGSVCPCAFSAAFAKHTPSHAFPDQMPESTFALKFAAAAHALPPSLPTEQATALPFQH